MEVKKTIMMMMAMMIALLFAASGASAHDNITNTLSAYADNAYTSDIDLNFTYTPISVYNIMNATLSGNWGGSWAANMTNTTTITNASWNNNLNLSGTVVPEGVWTWNVLISDYLGNSSFATANRTLTVDRTNPVASMTALPAPTMCNIRPIGNVTDTYKSTCSFTSNLDGAIVGSLSGTDCFGVETELSVGTHTITCTGTDLAGNTHTSSSVTVTCSKGGSGGSSYTPPADDTTTDDTTVDDGGSITDIIPDVSLPSYDNGNRVVGNIMRGLSNIGNGISSIIAKIMAVFGM